MPSGREIRIDDLKLTDRQLEFLRLYVDRGRQDAADCWQQTYPACKSRKAAINAASKVLAKKDVKRFLDRITLKVVIDIEISERKLLEETASVAFFDPLSIYDKHGRMLPMSQWPSITGRAIKAIEMDEDGNVSRIVWNDKMKAIELIGKHLKTWDRAAESNERDMIAEMLHSLAPTIGPPSLRPPVKGTLIEHDS